MKTTTTSLPKTESATHDQIALRAFVLWEAAGRPEGNQDHFWYLAERELRSGRPAARPPSAANAAILTSNAPRSASAAQT